MKKYLSTISVVFFLLSCASSPPSKPYQGLGTESIDSKILEQFRATPLNPELSRKIQLHLDIRAPGSGMISPDGKTLFYTWKITGITHVWKLSAPLGYPLQLTGGEDPTTINAISPNGQWLVLSRDRGGEENPGLYLQSKEGGSLIAIQHLPKVQTHFGFIDDASQYVYYTANDQKPDSFAIYRYEIQTGKKQLLLSEPGLWSIADHTGDDLLLKKSKGSLTSEFYRWNLNEKRLIPLFGQGEDEEFEALFSQNSNAILVLTPKFSEFRRLYRWDGTFTPLTDDLKINVEFFQLDRKKKKIYLQLNDGGYAKLQVLDSKEYKPLKLPDFPEAEHIRLGSISPNGRWVTLSIGHPQSPNTTFVWDWNTRKRVPWSKPAAPEIDLSQFVAAKLEFYPARDGTPIPMFVRTPKNCANKSCPIIIFFHGGPEGQAFPGFAPLYQWIMNEGFIIAEPNVRGSDGYGKTWLHSDDKAKRLNVITDIEDCSHYFRKIYARNGITPKIGAAGFSYGGYSTLMAMTYFSGSFDAGVEIVGISNLITFLKNTAPYRRILRINEYGDPEKDYETLLKLSPTSYVDRAQNPLMIIQGANDPRVPAGEAIQIYEAFQRKRVPTELILFADEGHGAKKRDNIALQFGHLVRFFKKHLQ